MSKQLQEQLQVRFKMLDDVFHNAIIALERLEKYLEAEEDINTPMEVTAVGTERDLHDDEKNPPTKKMIYGEMQLQCTTLFFQTKFDDKETFDKAMKFFLNDLLEWYGGRKDKTPNDVEKFFVPLVGALSRQITSPAEVPILVKTYVGDIELDISKFSDEEKEKAVTEGFKSYLKAVDVVGRSNEEFVKSGKEATLTIHKRGTNFDGYMHLRLSLSQIFEDEAPIILLDKLVKEYYPELIEHTDVDVPVSDDKGESSEDE